MGMADFDKRPGARGKNSVTWLKDFDEKSNATFLKVAYLECTVPAV